MTACRRKDRRNDRNIESILAAFVRSGAASTVTAARPSAPAELPEHPSVRLTQMIIASRLADSRLNDELQP